MAGRLSPLLDPARVRLHLQTADRLTALHEISGLLRTHPAVTDFAGFYADLLARDRLDTTNLGYGFAVPHARTDNVNAIVLAVGRTEQPIRFEDGEFARVLFMLGTPRSQPGDYLQVLSALCRVLKEPSIRQALLDAPDAETFVRAVAAAEGATRAPA